VDYGTVVPIGTTRKACQSVSARSAQRLKQKRGLSADTQAGKLDLVIRGFGHSIEAEAAVLCDGVRAQSSAGIMASWYPKWNREVSSAWAVGLRDRVLAPRETVVGLFGPGGGPAPEAATRAALLHAGAAPVSLTHES
jgi:hypothetical protein